jgi:hypothetical protein
MPSSTVSKTSAAEIRILPEWGALMALSLLSVPPLVAGLSGQGVARVISLAIGLTWLTLLPVTLISQRLSTAALPAVGAASFIVSLVCLSFNSGAFVVCTWTSLLMFMMTIPAGRRQGGR